MAETTVTSTAISQPISTTKIDESAPSEQKEGIHVGVEAVPEPPPPAYHSLYGSLKDHMRSTNDRMDPVHVFHGQSSSPTIFATVFTATSFGILAMFPIAMIAIGSMFLQDCPAEHYIPIYLIVWGCFSLFLVLLRLLGRCKQNEAIRQQNASPEPPATGVSGNATANESAVDVEKPPVLEFIVSLFLIGWFITGCVWVFRIYTPNFSDHKSAGFCNPIVYYFAFAANCVTGGVIVIFILVTCCCVCCAFCCCKRRF